MMIGKILKAACLLPLTVGLCQCDSLKPKPKALSPYALKVRLAYTPMARAAMLDHKDTIVVNAYYYGDPTPQAAAKADTLHRLALSDEKYGWSVDTRLVKVDGNVDTALLPEIRGEPQLLASAYSITTDAARDELVACKTWIGTVKEAQSRAPLIACELETGDKDSADDIVAADHVAADQAAASHQ